MDRIAGMARVVVDVMPKPEILDPQGKAVTGALARLGFAGVTVRQGKRFELDVEGELTEQRLAEVQRAAETLLANTVIETFNVRVERAEPASTGMEPQEVPATGPGTGTHSATDAGVTESGDTVGGALAQSSDVAKEAGKGMAGAADAGVTESGDPVGNPSAPPPEVASDPATGGSGALDARVEERGNGGDSDGRPLEETVGDTDVQSPRKAATDPVMGGPEALDARVEERETGGDSDGRLPEETVGDTDAQSPRKAASEPAEETDSALDAGVRKTKETLEESHARPKRVIAPDAEAEPPDPTPSGAR